jgi:hypothetical protein
MNLKREFNRIEHLLNGGLENTRKQAGKLVDQGAKRANETARRVRAQAETGARSAMDYEEAFLRHVRANTTLYAIGGALVIGLLVAKVVREIRQSRELERAPLL